MNFFKKNNLLLLIVFLSANCMAQFDRVKDDFIDPVKIPVLLSGNFGENRQNHFHFGIDIKTAGRIREKLYAPADGYISRINVNPFGYGKMISINHPNGYQTVYAHMDEFSPEVKEYVREYQYKNERYTFDIFPEPEKFPLKQGDFIGYTGNTGLSGGPHLHYEIRKSSNANPVNVLLFNNNIVDNIPPKFFHVALYPLSESSAVNGKQEKLIYKTEKGSNIYFPEGNPQIEVRGKFGVAFEVYEYMNNTGNIFGIYTSEVLVDGEKIYGTRMDYFSFYEYRYINSYLDYEEWKRSKRQFQKAFIEPNNHWSHYEDVVNKGIIEFNDTLKHKIDIVVSDVHGNDATLSFYVQSNPKADYQVKTPEHFVKLMKYEEENTFENENIKFTLPIDALYDNLQFKYKELETVDGAYGPVHQIHNKYTPIHKWFHLYIKPVGLPESLKTKALAATVDENGKLEAAGGSYENGFIKTSTRNFGKYTVAVDTVAPKIIPINISKGKDMSNEKAIKLKIGDDFSGIQAYNGYIDNNWVLFEFEQKKKLLFYTFDTTRLEKGKNHVLEVFVSDYKNNIKSYTINFYW